MKPGPFMPGRLPRNRPGSASKKAARASHLTTGSPCGGGSEKHVNATAFTTPLRKARAASFDTGALRSYLRGAFKEILKLFMQRRQFIKMFALTTASAGAAGSLWRGTVFGAIQPAGAGNVGRFSISLDDFPALNNEFSSIRLSVNPLTGGSEPFPDGDFYPILINRGERDQFFALDAACRHAGCVVPIFEESLSGSVCPCHGSIYGIDGTVLHDPATLPLISYNITFDGVKTLTVEVPGLGYSVASRLASSNRLRLEFPTHLNVTYEVRFRASMNPGSAWTAVPFALSPTEPADRLTLLGSSAPAVLFVNRSTAAGFYAVNIVLLDVT